MPAPSMESSKAAGILDLSGTPERPLMVGRKVYVVIQVRIAFGLTPRFHSGCNWR